VSSTFDGRVDFQAPLKRQDNDLIMIKSIEVDDTLMRLRSNELKKTRFKLTDHEAPWHGGAAGPALKSKRSRAQGSVAEMLESVSTDSRHYPQKRGARFAEGGRRFTGMPHMTTLRLRYLTWKLRAPCGISRRRRAGRDMKCFLATEKMES
jgi:hypothetical protein